MKPLILVPTLLLASTARAATFQVDPADAAAFATITDAINVAVDGDQVIVAPGLYEESLAIVDRAISVLAPNGATLDATSTGAEHAVLIEGTAETNLAGFTVRNDGGRGVQIVDAFAILCAVDLQGLGAALADVGTAIEVVDGRLSLFESTVSNNQGAAVFIDGDFEHTVDGCTFENNDNRGYFASALNLGNDSGGLSVYGSTFTGNHGPNSAAVAYLGDRTQGTFVGNEFRGNTASDSGNGGVLYGDTDAELTVEDCVFEDNIGRAMDLPSTLEGAGSLTLLNSTVAGQTLTAHDVYTTGAGVRLGRNVTAFVQDTVFDSNTVVVPPNASGRGGGALAGFGSDVMVVDSVFVNNEVLGGEGGAVWMGVAFGNPGGSWEEQGVVYDGNSASQGGGAASFDTMDGVSIQGATWIDNSSGARGGALHSAWGGLVVEGSMFDGNHAVDEGGAMYIQASAGFNQGHDVALLDTDFVGNDSDQHGGAIEASHVGGFVIDGCSFDANSAADDGGAIDLGYQWGELVATNTTFTRNVADQGGAVWAHGTSGSLQFEHTVFQDNGAREGGALWLAIAASMAQVNLVDNEASEAGGVAWLGVDGNIFALGYGSLEATNTAYVSNSAPAMYGVSTNNTADLSWSLWFDNGTEFGGSLATSVALAGDHVFSNPQFVDWTEDGDPTNDRLWPALDSPLIDRGDPAVLDEDGSISDIGAFGGPGAPTDVDEDGFAAPQDCDDFNAAVHPGAVEHTWNNVDDDCDGRTDQQSGSLSGTISSGGSWHFNYDW